MGGCAIREGEERDIRRRVVGVGGAAARGAGRGIELSGRSV